MYPNIRWLLCCTGFSLWGFTGQVLEFIIFVLVLSFYPTCTYIMTCTICQSNRSNSNDNIIILLLNIHWIKLYIVVSHFQKKDDINSSRWLFPISQIYPYILFYRAIYLWYHSRIIHPGWLLYCQHPYCLYNWLQVCIALAIFISPTIPSIPSYTNMT